MSNYIPTKHFGPIRSLVHVHEAKNSNSQYLIKEFKEFTGNQNTPRSFCVLRDRLQVLYILGKLVNRAFQRYITLGVDLLKRRTDAGYFDFS